MVGESVARLGLDDWQRGERTTGVLVAELGGALQQAGVEIENVSGIGLAAGGTGEQKRNLAIGRGVFRKIVVDTKGVASRIAEKLAHGAGRVGRGVLHGSRF